jgi:hypothetical protein
MGKKANFTVPDVRSCLGLQQFVYPLSLIKASDFTTAEPFSGLKITSLSKKLH